MARLYGPGLGAPAPGSSWWEQIAAQLNLLPFMGGVIGSAPWLSSSLTSGLGRLVAQNPTPESSMARYLMALQRYRDTVTGTAAQVRGAEQASRNALQATEAIMPQRAGSIGTMVGLAGVGGYPGDYGTAEAYGAPAYGGYDPSVASWDWQPPPTPDYSGLDWQASPPREFDYSGLDYSPDYGMDYASTDWAPPQENYYPSNAENWGWF